MQDHTKAFVGRGTVEFSKLAGEVVGVDRWTESHVESSSGSVAVFGRSVHVTPPAITAWSEAKQRLWVRLSDGKELSVPVGASVEARVGHAVELVLATGKLKGDKSQWCAVWNKTATKWWQIDRFPPCRIYDAWTSFWLGLFQGLSQASPFVALVCILALMTGLISIPVWLLGGFHRSWPNSAGDTLMLVFIGSGVLSVGTIFRGGFQSRRAEKRYKKAIANYVDTM